VECTLIAGVRYCGLAEGSPRAGSIAESCWAGEWLPNRRSRPIMAQARCRPLPYLWPQPVLRFSPASPPFRRPLSKIRADRGTAPSWHSETSLRHATLLETVESPSPRRPPGMTEVESCERVPPVRRAALATMSGACMHAYNSTAQRQHRRDVSSACLAKQGATLGSSRGGECLAGDTETQRGRLDVTRWMSGSVACGHSLPGAVESAPTLDAAHGSERGQRAIPAKNSAMASRNGGDYACDADFARVPQETVRIGMERAELGPLLGRFPGAGACAELLSAAAGEG
jgi:hypothetical protein